MMMCIGGVTDFEAQLTASVDRFKKNMSTEDMERDLRDHDWCHARLYQDRRNLGRTMRSVGRFPIEPKRPYSYGRRFIPAWLAAEREQCMGVELGEATGRTVWAKCGFVMHHEDPTVLHGWVE